MNRIPLFVILTWAVTAPSVRAGDPAPVSVQDTGTLMPAHGTVSTVPAGKWEDGLAAGNGNMGAMLYGDPRHDTLLVDHCKLWLPTSSREILPDAGEALPEMRNRIKESREDATHGYMHTGLAAAGLGMGDLAYQRIELLAKRRSIFPNMVDGHFGGPGPSVR